MITVDLPPALWASSEAANNDAHIRDRSQPTLVRILPDGERQSRRNAGISERPLYGPH